MNNKKEGGEDDKRYFVQNTRGLSFTSYEYAREEGKHYVEWKTKGSVGIDCKQNNQHTHKSNHVSQLKKLFNVALAWQMSKILKRIWERYYLCRS